MKSSTRKTSKFKFSPNDPVFWDGSKARVVTTWWDGQENRCEILVSTPEFKGQWSVRESSLELDKSRATL